MSLENPNIKDIVPLPELYIDIGSVVADAFHELKSRNAKKNKDTCISCDEWFGDGMIQDSTIEITLDNFPYTKPDTNYICDYCSEETENYTCEFLGQKLNFTVDFHISPTLYLWFYKGNAYYYSDYYLFHYKKISTEFQQYLGDRIGIQKINLNFDPLY